jgi:hypothetical protein
MSQFFGHGGAYALLCVIGTRCHGYGDVYAIARRERVCHASIVLDKLGFSEGASPSSENNYRSTS